MYRDRLAEPGESKRGARRHVGALLDLNPATFAQLGRGRRTSGRDSGSAGAGEWVRGGSGGSSGGWPSWSGRTRSSRPRPWTQPVSATVERVYRRGCRSRGACGVCRWAWRRWRRGGPGQPGHALALRGYWRR